MSSSSDDILETKHKVEHNFVKDGIVYRMAKTKKDSEAIVNLFFDDYAGSMVVLLQCVPHKHQEHFLKLFSRASD